MQIPEDELPEEYKKNQVTKGMYRWFLITINNPQQGLKETLELLEATYACGQLEQGEENGTIHVQAIAYYVTACRVTRFKKIGHAIGIQAKDAPRVRNYCRKKRTQLEPPIELGVFPEKSAEKSYSSALELAKQGRICEIDPEILIRNLGNLQKISSLYTEAYDHDDVRGQWFVGPPGTGKSYEARSRYQPLYLKQQNKWWDNYQAEPYVLLDDMDHGGACLGHYIKIWADRYACTGEIKGSTVRLRHKVFVVTSNYTIQQLWPSDPEMCKAIERRFTVTFFNTVYEKKLSEFIE